MSNSIRCFLAVRISAAAPLLELLNELAELGHGVRPTPLDKLHITVKFLGDVRSSDIPAIIEATRASCRKRDPFDIDLSGTGVFPHRGRPNIVWVGMNNVDALSALAGEIDEQLAKLGFAPEARPFQAHVTVGRLRGRTPRGLLPLVDAYAKTPFGAATVQSLELMQSEPGRQGSVYTSMDSMGLAE